MLECIVLLIVILDLKKVDYLFHKGYLLEIYQKNKKINLILKDLKIKKIKSKI